MSQQLICDDCGERIDTSQPYYSGSFQQVQETGGTLVVVTPAVNLDYHVEHSPIPPTITALQPNSIAGDAGFVEVHAIGTGFSEDCVIVFGGEVLGTAFESPTDLRCTIGGTHGVGETPLLVRRGDLESNALTFTITEPEPAE